MIRNTFAARPAACDRRCVGHSDAASMAYDSKRNRLVIATNDWNTIAIVDLNAPIGARA